MKFIGIILIILGLIVVTIGHFNLLGDKTDWAMKSLSVKSYVNTAKWNYDHPPSDMKGYLDYLEDQIDDQFTMLKNKQEYWFDFISDHQEQSTTNTHLILIGGFIFLGGCIFTTTGHITTKILNNLEAS